MIPIPERFTFFIPVDMIENLSISNDSTSSIQTLLSALESHQFMPYGSRALPPVGNFAPP